MYYDRLMKGFSLFLQSSLSIFALGSDEQNAGASHAGADSEKYKRGTGLPKNSDTAYGLFDLQHHKRYVFYIDSPIPEGLFQFQKLHVHSTIDLNHLAADVRRHV